MNKNVTYSPEYVVTLILKLLKIVYFNLKWVLNPYQKQTNKQKNVTQEDRPCPLPCTTEIQRTPVPNTVESEHLSPQVGYELHLGGDAAEDEGHSEELSCKATAAAADIWMAVLRHVGREDAGFGGPALVPLQVFCSCSPVIILLSNQYQHTCRWMDHLSIGEMLTGTDLHRFVAFIFQLSVVYCYKLNRVWIHKQKQKSSCSKSLY